MPHVHANGMDIHYVECGQGPALVMGHSLALDHRLYDPVVERLSQHHRVIRPDFRGHGLSTKPHSAYSLAEMTDDLVAFVDALALETFSYVGLSMGGMIGMRLALRCPERIRALALMDTSADVEPGRVAFEQWANMMRGRPASDSDVEMFLGISVSPAFLQANPPRLDVWRERLKANDPEGNYHAQMAVLRRDSVLERLGELEMPVLFVVGEVDSPTPQAVAEEMHRRVSGSALHVVPGAGHLTVVEEPQQVGAVLENFLNGERRAS